MKASRIDTTIGDLICAIADAAEEAHIEKHEINEFTFQMLCSVLERYQSAMLESHYDQN